MSKMKCLFLRSQSSEDGWTLTQESNQQRKSATKGHLLDFNISSSAVLLGVWPTTLAVTQIMKAAFTAFIKSTRTSPGRKAGCNRSALSGPRDSCPPPSPPRGPGSTGSVTAGRGPARGVGWGAWGARRSPPPKRKAGRPCRGSWRPSAGARPGETRPPAVGQSTALSSCAGGQTTALSSPATATARNLRGLLCVVGSRPAAPA